ncbi:hypothetical protein GN330_00465 [Nitratireductor sp. CAU 1489]|uniref:Flagellar FliJ protein n=1 Tax=Nitratireductor arenosus TaxID=2682096 RepID=A0A844QAQ0_9HYPH|nr:hypothetical protein [Nitratireductor arenosus]MVA95724.1 hypothetical protein [Nitratireductor arenosus]
MEKSQRLARLLRVQSQLKALHETQRAGHLRDAHEAEARASEVAERKQGPDSLSALFPDLYERSITRAFQDRDRALAAAAEEAGKVAIETSRCRVLERNRRAAFSQEERAREERDGLESVERMLGRAPGDK